MQFELSEELIEKIQYLIEQGNDEELLLHLEDVHHADIAEILTEINLEEATYIVRLLDSEKTAEAIDTAIIKLIRTAFSTAENIISSQKQKLEKIVAELIKNETIEKDEFEQLLSTT